MSFPTNFTPSENPEGNDFRNLDDIHVIYAKAIPYSMNEGLEEFKFLETATQIEAKDLEEYCKDLDKWVDRNMRSDINKLQDVQVSECKVVTQATKYQIYNAQIESMEELQQYCPEFYGRLEEIDDQEQKEKERKILMQMFSCIHKKEENE